MRRTGITGMANYSVRLATPSPDDYRRLRVAAGMTPRSAEATAAGLPNTFIGVIVEHDERAIGMGRIVGDGRPEDVLLPELLSRAYGIRIDVDDDPLTGRLRTRAIGRHHKRSERLSTSS